MTYLIKGDKMKDIKSYVIGFLTCACLFLIMGQTKETQSKYQFAVQRGIDIGETYYLYNNEIQTDKNTQLI